MDRVEEVYENSSHAGGNDSLNEVSRDDSAAADITKNLAEFIGNESPPLETFNQNHSPNNRLSSLAFSISRIPSPNVGSQFDEVGVFNGNMYHGNVDSGNVNSSNNLFEGCNFPRNQPNNNSLPVNESLTTEQPSSNVAAQNGPVQLLHDYPFVVGSNNLLAEHNFTFNGQDIPLPLRTSHSMGMPSWKAGPQNNDPQLFRGNYVLTASNYGKYFVSNYLLQGFNFPRNQASNNLEPLHRSLMIGGPQNNNPVLLADTPHSNNDSAQWYNGGNRYCVIQEPVTGVGTSSASVPPSLIAKESNRAPLNPISISNPRNDQFIPNGTTAKLAEKEALPLQELRKLPDTLNELLENDGNVEDHFENMNKYADFAADELGKKLREENETDPERQKKNNINNIHAKKSNKRRRARELYLRGTVCVLVDGSKTLMEETKRQKLVIEDKDKQIELLTEMLKFRSNPTGLPKEPPPDDSNGGNSGGDDSSGRGPGPGGSGGPSSRNTQAGGFNGMTFSNLQPSRDGSPSDDLSVRTASRMSVEKLLKSSSDSNSVSNSRDNVQSSLEKVYQDFLSEEHSDDDECDDNGESSDEGSDHPAEMNYGTGDHCSERENNERKACSTRNDYRRTSYTEKKDNWQGDCTEQVDSAILGGMKMNERETADGSNHSSQKNNGECDDFTKERGNARVGCIEMNDIGQGERKNNTNQSHLNLTPSSKPLLVIPPTPRLLILQGTVDISPMPYLPIDRYIIGVPPLELPASRSSRRIMENPMIAE